MAIFGANKEEEYEDEDGAALTKKFRDLRPENKKKRKEPQKPWGKRERIIVLVVLLATVIISAILGFSVTGGTKLHLSLPRFNLNSLNIFREQTIVIRKNQ
ncbi:MAG: hypothetical protein ABSC49_00345 [Candidatus Microgenomates bacterium]|jgi:hypothetical protein